MKVAELIDFLQQVPNQESDVYVDDPDWGWLDVSEVEIIGNDTVMLNTKL